MTSRERVLLLAICASGLFSGFTAVLTLLDASEALETGDRLETSALPPVKKPSDRLSALLPEPVPPETPALPAADPLADAVSQDVLAYEGADGEDLDTQNGDGWTAETDTWSTETESNSPVDRALKPKPPAAAGEPLPWQQKPGAGSIAATPSKPKPVTLAERLSQISPGARARLAEKFREAKTAYPPAEMALVAVKDEKTLELHARTAAGAWTFIHRYPVLAASGVTGPKLKKGDKQVPEGVYGISFLNPNSRFHVSMRVNYPNAFDRRMAEADGRKELGGDIMIHGKAESIGCLAVGDAAAEELFVLAHETGLPKIKLVIAPTDFRRKDMPEPQPGQPAWVPQLYAEVASAMAPFKAPASGGLLSFFTD